MSAVTHPSHYNAGRFEVIEIIEDQRLNFARGNALKYICRAGKKDPTKECEDLQKAVWYLQREIEILKAAQAGREPVRPNDMNPKHPYAAHLMPTSATAALSSSPPELPVGTAKNVTDGSRPTPDASAPLAHCMTHDGLSCMVCGWSRETIVKGYLVCPGS